MAASEEIDLESIAAFIDGRLTGAERDRVVKLLAESEAAFETYTEALRIHEELGGGSPVVSLAAHRERRMRRWLPAASVAAAAVLVFTLLPIMRPGRSASVLDADARSILAPLAGSPDGRTLVGATQLATALGPQWDQRDWSVTRGIGSARADSVTSLRLGVRATDLQVALVTGDRDRAARLAGEMGQLLESVDLSEGSRADYGAIRMALTRGDSIGLVADTAARAENTAGALLNSPWFGLGRWLGAAELAAHARSSAFFNSRRTSRFLHAAIEGGRLAPSDASVLREVERMLNGGVSNEELEQMEQRFAALIRKYGG
jgi:hypothetical protein